MGVEGSGGGGGGEGGGSSPSSPLPCLARNSAFLRCNALRLTAIRSAMWSSISSSTDCGRHRRRGAQQGECTPWGMPAGCGAEVQHGGCEGRTEQAFCTALISLELTGREMGRCLSEYDSGGGTVLPFLGAPGMDTTAYRPSTRCSIWAQRVARGRGRGSGAAAWDAKVRAR